MTHHGKVQDHENITDPDPHTTFTVVIFYSCMYAQEVAVFCQMILTICLNFPFCNSLDNFAGKKSLII